MALITSAVVDIRAEPYKVQANGDPNLTFRKANGVWLNIDDATTPAQNWLDALALIDILATWDNEDGNGIDQGGGVMQSTLSGISVGDT